MKKLLCFLLAMLILIPTASAETSFLAFSTYGSTKNVEHLFDGDAFALDLFMGDDLTAVFVETCWDNGKVYTKAFSAKMKSRKDDHFLYFVLENDYIIKGHYDDNEIDFWVDFDGGSIKLHYMDEFIPFLDYMGER